MEKVTKVNSKNLENAFANAVRKMVKSNLQEDHNKLFYQGFSVDVGGIEYFLNPQGEGTHHHPFGLFHMWNRMFFNQVVTDSTGIENYTFPLIFEVWKEK